MAENKELLDEYKYTQDNLLNIYDFLDIVVKVFIKVHGKKFIIQEDTGMYHLNSDMCEDERFNSIKVDFTMIEKIQTKYIQEKQRLRDIEVELQIERGVYDLYNG